MDISKVKVAANRFFMKHYPQILTCSPHEKDQLRGKLKVLTSISHIDNEFFNTFFGKDLEDTGEWSAFAAELYGIGKNKFRYNENRMDDFDHSQCKTLTDVVYFREKLQHEANQEHKDHPLNKEDKFDENDFLEFVNVWIYVTNELGIPTPYAINDVCSHAFWYLEPLAYEYADELMKPKKVKGPHPGSVDPDSGGIYYNIQNSYEDKVVSKLEDDMLFSVSEIATKFAYEVNDHFSKEPLVFHKVADDDYSANTLVIPNIEAGNKIDILNFFDSLKTVGSQSTDVIDEYSSTLVDRLKEDIKIKFEELYHIHKNSTSIESYKDGGFNILMSPEQFEEMENLEDNEDT
jgi:hypothetical protein